tara:strand:+ start:12736 stop:13254 length:519 start_codon:yes stop_codon:yes gene_type:complete
LFSKNEQRIEKGERGMDSSKIQLKKTKKYGLGVFASKPIKKGEVLAEFDGKIYDEDFEDWTTDLQNHTVQCGPERWRDSKGWARYFNHSCEPNCGIRGLYKIVAMRDIKKGEHLTWDYEMTEKSDWWRMRCRCGSPLCRKRIGNFENLPEERRQSYRGFISWWLTHEKKVRK